VSLSGAHSVQITAERLLEVSASGASDVQYRGKPALEVALSGANRVTAVEGHPTRTSPGSTMPKAQ